METENNGKVRPEKLLLQTYASYVQRFCRYCKDWWKGRSLRMRRWIGIILCLAVVSAIAVSYIFRKRPAPEMLPVVAVETVRTENVNIYGEYAGRIRAQQFVEIRARVEGYLERMLFAEGTYIEKGQTLFIIGIFR